MYSTYLQRLKVDPKSGLNYEYMGYAEYEFGATVNARTNLAKLFMAGNLSATIVQMKDTMVKAPISAVVFCEERYAADYAKWLGNLRNKGVTGLDQPSTVAWLAVRPMPPALILRHTTDVKHATLYLQPAIEYLKSQENAVDPSKAEQPWC